MSQEIYLQLWRSSMDVARSRNATASYLIRERRARLLFVSLDDLPHHPEDGEQPSRANRELNLREIEALIQKLRPLDRQIVVCYLEDLDAATIGEITALPPRPSR